MSGLTAGETPLRVGFVISSRRPLRRHLDGSSNYEASVLKILETLEREGLIEVIHFFRAPRSGLLAMPSKRQIHGIPIKGPSVWELLFSFFPSGIFGKFLPRFRLLRLERKLQANHIDLVYLASPNPLALRLDATPFIFTVWDFGHEDLRGFPEASSRWEWSFRQMVYQAGIGRAFHLFVESQSTAARVKERYFLNQSQLSVIGLLPDAHEIPEKQDLLTEPYLIYPAARWKHKNHETVLRALKLVLEKHSSLRLVLTGADKGYQQQIRRLIEELDLGEAVVDLELQDREAVLRLISGAKALLMPSMLGPTNLPPLEALALGTHAIVSDLHEFGGGLDDRLIRVPARDYVAWAHAISTVMELPNPDPVNFSNFEAIESHRRVFSSFRMTFF